MNSNQLFEQIKLKRSYLCVGLDTDITKIPSFLLEFEDPIFEFNKRIIDATKDYAVAYKPNIAFYESLGSKGWDSLEKTIQYIPKNIFTIADAKRGDIGNTSTMYAKTFFDTYSFDSVTVAPYMGKDSVVPFLEFNDKWVILLGHTSNQGSDDFQLLKNNEGELFYETVIKKSQAWGTEDNLMFVIGATKAEKFKSIRALAPNHFFLVPGVGAQGGDLKELSEFGLNQKCGLLVNSSRGIIYASNKEDFAEVAKEKAKDLQEDMSLYLKEYLNI